MQEIVTRIFHSILQLLYRLIRLVRLVSSDILIMS